ncbi:hypothetical protein F5148DRAFT_1225128 [Russula earlei]|uniref:Uncharacterized protein n=1 Tax=Russula earlei TaxID=71964 RepID=A0ACC0U2P6_9AGAM|nr:hypothetical protein F5148DRAFT_1225128 [Russula earlei]
MRSRASKAAILSSFVGVLQTSVRPLSDLLVPQLGSQFARGLMQVLDALWGIKHLGRGFEGGLLLARVGVLG